jgi:hypothetical protein
MGRDPQGDGRNPLAHARVFHPAARREQQEAAKWYREKQAGLDRRFYEYLIACIERIAVAPFQFPLISEKHRRALVEVFPYQIFFEVSGADIRVLAVAHSRRRPFYWLGRN